MNVLEIRNFISGLPESVINGDKIFLHDEVIRDIFKFVNLNSSDIFYDLGCGISNAVLLASKEFKVAKSVGVDIDTSICKKLESIANQSGLHNVKIINDDLLNVSLQEASVILFWFTDEFVIEEAIKKFEKLKDGTKVISIWSPPGSLLPSKVSFPFFVCEKPFKFANSLSEQILSICGNKCLDFTTAWILIEKYLNTLNSVPGQYKRFINVLQSIILWINAWNAEVTCEDEIPPPVETYVGILRTFFNLDLTNLIKRK